MLLNKSLLAGIFIAGSISVNAQSLLNLVDSAQGNNQPLAPLGSTWKDIRVINAQTTKTPAPGVMLFRIMHCFGNIGGASGGGVHTLYGFDAITDMYFSFEFGITKNLELSAGRSKAAELIDLGAKYRLLTQKAGGMPISLALYGDAGITPELEATLYAGADSSVKKSFLDRLSYVSELLIDRRFGDHVSVELIGGYSYRNYVLQNQNTENLAYDQNGIPYAGIVGRLMFTKHAGIILNYYYIDSQFRMNNTTSPFYNSFSVGYEIETGGHVFEVYLCNSAYINENNLIPNTSDTWSKGGFKLGFSISRAFNL